MTKEELIQKLSTSDVVVTDDEYLNIKISSTNDMNIVDYLKIVYEYENDIEYNNVLLDLKELPTKDLVEAVKYSLHYEELKDAVMILNIINFIKTYNNLEESFFESKDVYVNSIEELLDLKLALRNDLRAFSKKLSIYFISLFKTYPKTSFTPTDVIVKMPSIFGNIILGTDLYTLSGIFSFSESFDTKECVYVDEAYKYISNLLMKNSISMAFFNMFTEEQKELENNEEVLEESKGE